MIMFVFYCGGDDVEDDCMAYFIQLMISVHISVLCICCVWYQNKIESLLFSENIEEGT